MVLLVGGCAVPADGETVLRPGDGTVASTPAAAAAPVAVEAAAPAEPLTPPPPPPPDCTRLKCIALTFDDGPYPQTTPQLLDILERESVPATMFVVGSMVKAYPEVLEREHAMGLEIANHTWSHPKLPSRSGEKVASELTRTQDIITEITGTTPTLMRPPYGERSARTDQIAGDLGLAVVLWDANSLDWKHKDPYLIAQTAVADAEPGSVLLMHDIHQRSIDAVPLIIDQLRAQGYTFVTVSQLYEDPEPGRLYATP